MAQPTEGGDRGDPAVPLSLETLSRFVAACEPVIAKVLSAHFRARGATGTLAALDEEDLRATARLRVIERLKARNAEPIENLQGYAARVAHVVWAEYCRARQPERTRFLDQVRYFIENDASDDPVGRWNDDDGIAVCGFLRWRGKRARRSGDLPATVAEHVSEWVARRRARGAVRQLLRLVDAPVALRELNDSIGRLVEESKEPAASPAGSAAASTHAEVFHRENLRWLWSELANLPVRQRVAFLLHAAVAKEFEHEGIASIREIAERLELDAQQLAAWWFGIPLDDRTIAGALSATRQEVINLRKAARVTLGRRLAVFLELDPPSPERET